METITARAEVADYARLLSEAAYVLSALAEATTEERRDEFVVLQAIYAESASRSIGSAQISHHAPGLPGHLRSMFSSVMAIGAVLTPLDEDELPVTAVAGVHVVESMTRCLAESLDQTLQIESAVAELSRGAAALNPGRMQPSAPGDLPRAVALADKAMAAFVCSLCASTPSLPPNS